MLTAAEVKPRTVQQWGELASSRWAAGACVSFRFPLKEKDRKPQKTEEGRIQCAGLSNTFVCKPE